jgi:hypothetical protein
MKIKNTPTFARVFLQTMRGSSSSQSSSLLSSQLSLLSFLLALE